MMGGETQAKVESVASIVLAAVNVPNARPGNPRPVSLKRPPAAKFSGACFNCGSQDATGRCECLLVAKADIRVECAPDGGPLRKLKPAATASRRPRARRPTGCFFP